MFALLPFRVVCGFDVRMIIGLKIYGYFQNSAKLTIGIAATAIGYHDLPYWFIHKMPTFENFQVQLNICQFCAPRARNSLRPWKIFQKKCVPAELMTTLSSAIPWRLTNPKLRKLVKTKLIETVYFQTQIPKDGTKCGHFSSFQSTNRRHFIELSKHATIMGNVPFVLRLLPFFVLEFLIRYARMSQTR